MGYTTNPQLVSLPDFEKPSNSIVKFFQTHQLKTFIFLGLQVPEAFPDPMQRNLLLSKICWEAAVSPERMGRFRAGGQDDFKKTWSDWDVVPWWFFACLFGFGLFVYACF